MTEPSPQLAPRIAVIVPIFRHSVLLAEAVQSVLDQRADFGIHIFLVNDGCPHAETEAVCRDYALACPDRVTYLRKPNGGLSDARNHGIRHAMAAFPGIEALYMLDADNKLRPDALARTMAALDAHPEADWIYPNIDMIGLEFAGDYGGDYSLLVHTGMNISEAGSLIRRRVFDAGVYFDTDFKLGFEDWDFFLSAGRAGFRGRNLEDFGFQYRKRPESMLADSARDAEMIRGTMRHKHRDLFAPESLLALEQAECPRFAIFTADTGEVRLTVDPMAEAARRVTLDCFEQMIWRHRIAPTRFHFPPFVVLARGAVMAALEKAGALRWALWKLEWMAERRGVASLSLSTSQNGRFGFTDRSTPQSLPETADVLVVRSKWLLEFLSEKGPDGPAPSDPTRRMYGATLDLRLPPETADAASSGQRGLATEDMRTLFGRLHGSPFRAASFSGWEWRVGDIHQRPRAHHLVREPFGGAPVYPKMPDGRRHVGLILPLVEFGGVEKVALNMAKGLRSHGWVPHLFVVEATEGAITQEWRSTFESVNFLSAADFALWEADGETYFGTDVPNWATGGNHSPALGLMGWLDVVINCHGGAISGIMGQLRRLGVVTANSLHLNELSPFGRPLGNTYLGLAYEHAYNLFLPCSHQLGDWCHAMGIPSEKILPVPNAPSFPADPDRLAVDQAARNARGETDPLRVIFLGRLDRQKGIDKLSECVIDTRQRGVAIDWRVVGKSVIGSDAPPLPGYMEDLLEPPLTEAGDLLDAFAWADVMVLLSSYEGLPLTILEAMRSGVVTVATDVGAVSEVVTDGENGVLLNVETASRDCVQALGRLSADRALLRRLSDRARSDMQDRDWQSATAPLHARLERMVAPPAKDDVLTASKGEQGEPMIAAGPSCGARRPG
ncbi:glycosyltransferase [Tropicimonas sediminicola]|uniref:Glycosyltransferase involved in cell wall bisynthesis n=1 Tax=Tropicimonas sediminicola TaxID=1031541 RepID=A0A239EG99_9RHOB|nr:glycosyltransferase [Tropicimonas sediminicola]SNS43780.1 Glycosyltransferase involved in cell wall bisynthesis [Tropicimonas sediminicola]